MLRKFAISKDNKIYNNFIFGHEYLSEQTTEERYNNRIEGND